MILDVVEDRDAVEARFMRIGRGTLGGIQAEIERRCCFFDGRRGGISRLDEVVTATAPVVVVALVENGSKELIEVEAAASEAKDDEDPDVRSYPKSLLHELCEESYPSLSSPMHCLSVKTMLFCFWRARLP